MFWSLRRAEGGGPWAWTVLVICGFAIGIWGLVWMGRGLISLSWEEAPGVVSNSRVVKNMPRVYVDYKVDGKAYSTRELQIGGPFILMPDWAEEHVARYPKGKQVPVYYDPDDPQRAVIEPGLHLGNMAFFLIGLGIYIGSKLARHHLA